MKTKKQKKFKKVVERNEECKGLWVFALFILIWGVFSFWELFKLKSKYGIEFVDVSFGIFNSVIVGVIGLGSLILIIFGCRKVYWVEVEE